MKIDIIVVKLMSIKFIGTLMELFPFPTFKSLNLPFAYVPTQSDL